MCVWKEREKWEEKGERNSERKRKKWEGGQIREKKTEDEGRELGKGRGGGSGFKK